MGFLKSLFSLFGIINKLLDLFKDYKKKRERDKRISRKQKIREAIDKAHETKGDTSDLERTISDEL